MSVDEDLIARLALLSLPRVGPARARWLLAGQSPAVALDHLRAGRLPPDAGSAPPGVTAALVDRWATAVRTVDGEALLDRTIEAGFDLLAPTDEGWPFGDDPEPPVLAFVSGDARRLSIQPRVGIVGTRRCTAIGREVAHRFGAGLAEAGVPVVSGLASGIDGAAHAGTLTAGGLAIGVVGTGLDVIYPRSNSELWRRVGRDGVLLSESMLGAKPERWRFPARNRLIAALSDVVVVVESHAEGGSLLTVTEAADRGVEVLAVPGSVTSPASMGTNRLLIDGCAPACSVDDILDAVGVAPPARASPETADLHDPAMSDQLGPLGAAIAADVRAGAVHVDELVAAHRRPIPEILAELARLEALGFTRLEGSTVQWRP